MEKTRKTFPCLFGKKKESVKVEEGEMKIRIWLWVNGGHLVNIRFNNVLIYIIVTWHRIKQCTVKIMKVLRIKLT